MGTAYEQQNAALQHEIAVMESILESKEQYPKIVSCCVVIRISTFLGLLILRVQSI
ncbi:hypothetical protein ABH892_003216 [Paenibacillus sp. RC254]